MLYLFFSGFNIYIIKGVNYAVLAERGKINISLDPEKYKFSNAPRSIIQTDISLLQLNIPYILYRVAGKRYVIQVLTIKMHVLYVQCWATTIRKY